MKIHDIIFEECSTTSALMSSVVMPMTPGTRPDDARRAVDPFGYGPNSNQAKKNNKKKTVPGYPNIIKRVY